MAWLKGYFPFHLSCGTLFPSSCVIHTSPVDCSDDSWRDTFFGKYEHGALWLRICGAIERHIFTYLLTYSNSLMLLPVTEMCCIYSFLCYSTERWGVGVVICLERVADLHIAQLMPLPLTVSCFIKIQIDFTFLVLAHPGSPGQRAVKRVCVYVCVATVQQGREWCCVKGWTKIFPSCLFASWTSHQHAKSPTWKVSSPTG